MRIATLVVVASCLATAVSCQAADRWEKDIRAFEAADRSSGYHRGGIVFLGSSSIRGWQTLREDFAALDVINRGFGGSQIADSTRYLDRIVVSHRPRLIVFYAGDNDIAAGRSPERVYQDYRHFTEKVHALLPGTRIAFIAIKPSPSRWRFAPQMRRANEMIAAFSRRTPGLDYVDVWPAMLDGGGNPRKELFKPDMLHLNDAGYKLWTAIVRPHLM